MSEISPKKVSGQESPDSSLQAMRPDLRGMAGFTKEFEGALNSLSELDGSGKLREDAIRNAKAIIKNWKPPTDQQIDRIIFKMRDELMA